MKLENTDTRWNRIEKKHINAVKLCHRSEVASDICKNLLKNKNFIRDHHMKYLLGDTSNNWYLDPNLVMDLRHERANQYRRFTVDEEDTKHIQVRNILDERQRFQKMLQINEEIEKFKQNLHAIRSKVSKTNSTTSSVISDELARNAYTIDNIDTKHGADNYGMEYEESVELSEMNEIASNIVTTDSYDTPFLYSFDAMHAETNILESSWSMFLSEDSRLYAASADEDAVDSDDGKNSSILLTPKFSTTTQMKLAIQPKKRLQPESVEFQITPTFTLNIRETQSTTRVQGHAANNTEEKPTFDKNKCKINQQLSILVQKIDINSCPDKSSKYMTEDKGGEQQSVERNRIIDELFHAEAKNDRIQLQKYFLRWVHFTTIEKLLRRNPEQTRLQKMQAFLQTITVERKKALTKLRQANATESGCDEHRFAVKLQQHCSGSPRLMLRKYNNKIKSQQDIIELQRIKLQRQQRVIAELKLSKLLEDTDDSETRLKEQLKYMAKNGCQNSRSKARCLQIASDLKDQDDDETQSLLAKGLSAPKFLIEMQARALEREMRHQKAQERRVMLERDKELLRMAAEEEKRIEDEESKRERIRELRRKRHEEKERQAKLALEKIKRLADLGKAKDHHRFRALKWVFEHFRNLIAWKKHNEKKSKAFRRQLLCRSTFEKWHKYTKRVWEERKGKAALCYTRHCLSIAWKQWQRFYLVEHSKVLLAIDWYELKLSERILRDWIRVTAQRRLVFEIKFRKAEAHHNCQLMWKVLEHWRHLHAIIQIEQETEARRERWRNKIHELIPDYAPTTWE